MRLNLQHATLLSVHKDVDAISAAGLVVVGLMQLEAYKTAAAKPATQTKAVLALCRYPETGAGAPEMMNLAREINKVSHEIP